MTMLATDLKNSVAHLNLGWDRLFHNFAQKLPIALMLILFLLSGCGRNRTEPAPSTTATVAPVADTATPTPLADDAAAPPFQSEETLYGDMRHSEMGYAKMNLLGSDRSDTQVINARYGYTLTLPSGWWMLDLPKGGEEVLVTSVAQQMPEYGLAGAAQHFADREEGVRTEIIARKIENGDTSVSMTLLVIPRHGLSLEQYLTGALAEIAETDAAIQIEEHGIDDELRVDGVPIATLQYTHAELPTRSTTYYHAVGFDSSAEHLLAITFATPSTHFVSERSAMQGIIADLELRQ